MHSPKTPQPTAAQLEQESAQMDATALLDKQENERRKRLLSAAAGLRAFAGSAISRAAPSNTAGDAPAAAPAVAPGSKASGSAFVGGGGGGGARGTSFAKV